MIQNDEPNGDGLTMTPSYGWYYPLKFQVTCHHLRHHTMTGYENGQGLCLEVDANDRFRFVNVLDGDGDVDGGDDDDDDLAEYCGGYRTCCCTDVRGDEDDGIHQHYRALGASQQFHLDRDDREVQNRTVVPNCCGTDCGGGGSSVEPFCHPYDDTPWLLHNLGHTEEGNNPALRCSALHRRRHGHSHRAHDGMGRTFLLTVRIPCSSMNEDDDDAGGGGGNGSAAVAVGHGGDTVAPHTHHHGGNDPRH